MLSIVIQVKYFKLAKLFLFPECEYQYIEDNIKKQIMYKNCSQNTKNIFERISQLQSMHIKLIELSVL